MNICWTGNIFALERQPLSPISPGKEAVRYGFGSDVYIKTALQSHLLRE